MLDTFFTPVATGDSDVQIFTIPSAVANLEWHTWLRPRGKTMCSILCIGGAGGGGGGFTGVAATARGGGGGGGGSGVTKILIPLILLPDILYIQVGAGGAGVGSGGGTAGSGLLSFVCVYPDTGVLNVLASSGAAGATGGGTGTAAAVGAAGAGSTIMTTALMPLGVALGVMQSTFIVGPAGQLGGAVAGAIGAATTLLTTGICTMGAPGGAGTTAADFAGGVITAGAGLTTISDSRPVGAAAGSNAGSSGPLLWKPFWSYCGLGGSSSNAGVGGSGGYGAPGSGGGGGGGGTTGGRGGDGGPGIVIITCW